MEVNKYLLEVAYIDDMEICDSVSKVYKSNFNNSYITHVGMEESVEFLANREITQELTHGVGFSPKENKWYGWSHRAIYGFSVGSECKKGDCHYRASNIDDEIQAAMRFWDDEHHVFTEAELLDDDTIHVKWKYDDNVPNEKLRGTICGVDWQYDSNSFGRGEWVAKTLEDAKQMAIDFNKGVS